MRSKAYDAFLEAAHYEIKSQMAKEYKGETIPMEGPYSIIIEFKMVGKGATDGDNMEAAVFDLLQRAGVITDDKEVLHCMWSKTLDADKYETDITIRHATAWQKK